MAAYRVWLGILLIVVALLGSLPLGGQDRAGGRSSENRDQVGVPRSHSGAGDDSSKRQISAPSVNLKAGDRARRDLIRREFKLNGAASVGQPVDLVFVMNPLVDLPGATVEFVFPDVVAVTKGSTIVAGDYRANVTVEYRLTVVASQTGDWSVGAVVRSPALSGGVRTRHATLAVGQAVELVDREPQRLIWTATAPIVTGKSAPIPSTEPAESGLSPLSTTTVWGYMEYQDDNYEWHPVRWAQVELWEDIPWWFDRYWQSTQTDANGYFTITIATNSTLNLYFKINCINSAAECVDAGGATSSVRAPYQTLRGISRGQLLLWPHQGLLPGIGLAGF